MLDGRLSLFPIMLPPGVGVCHSAMPIVPQAGVWSQDDHDDDTGDQKLSVLKLEHNHSGCG